MEIAILVGVLFFVLGIAMLIGGVVSFVKKRRELANSISTSGVVTELVRVTGQRSYLYVPVVQFETASKQAVSFQSSVGGMPARHSVGQQVKVVYDPGNPQKAEIDSAMSLWLVPSCMLGMGLVFTLLGLCLSAMFTLVVLNPPQ